MLAVYINGRQMYIPVGEVSVQWEQQEVISPGVEYSLHASGDDSNNKL